jgi:hypothetical protein
MRLLTETKKRLSLSSVPRNFYTEHTERLSDFCVETLLETEDREVSTTRGESFAAREGADCQFYHVNSARYKRHRATRLSPPYLRKSGGFRFYVAHPTLST